MTGSFFSAREGSRSEEPFIIGGTRHNRISHWLISYYDGETGRTCNAHAVTVKICVILYSR